MKTLKKWQAKKLRDFLLGREHPLYILDWHLDSGILWLKENRYDYRIVSNNGINFMLTHDYKPGRLSLYLERGFITKIEIE